ncbi:MAG: FkbM family methyltransferase [Methylobacter sp.]|nr:FkbM family methyltransferase [Methylobacter sp.]
MMKEQMMKKLRRLIRRLYRATMAFVLDVIMMSRLGRFLFEEFLSVLMQRTRKVTHEGVELVFAVPNECSWARADTFSIKEPETLEWVDGMEQGSVVWDIGANVGLYSCYAAKRRGCKVYAFEPSVFNLELLARNILLNDLTEKVVIVPLPLSDHLSISTLNMSMTYWGGAISTFGESYTWDGTPLNKVFEFSTVGLSMDDAMSLLNISQPDYIKMDVDGIEHLILKGGMSVLSKVRGVLIEIDEEFEQQSADTFQYLSAAGLELLGKHHSEMFEGTSVFNQIWRRKK